MTLNGVIALILRYFTEFCSFGADYVKVVDDGPVMSGAEYRLSLTFRQKLTHSAARSLCNS